MKFTNGYWLMRDEITPLYAVEYHSHKITEFILYFVLIVLNLQVKSYN